MCLSLSSPLTLGWFICISCACSPVCGSLLCALWLLVCPHFFIFFSFFLDFLCLPCVASAHFLFFYLSCLCVSCVQIPFCKNLTATTSPVCFNTHIKILYKILHHIFSKINLKLNQTRIFSEPGSARRFTTCPSNQQVRAMYPCCSTDRLTFHLFLSKKLNQKVTGGRCVNK